MKPGTPEVEHQTSNLRNTAVGKLFRSVGAFLLNLAFAVLGTATIESSIWSLIGHAHSPKCSIHQHLRQRAVIESPLSAITLVI
jgi:hypothetical protein